MFIALAVVTAVVAVLIVQKLKLSEGFSHLNRQALLLGGLGVVMSRRVLQAVGLLWKACPARRGSVCSVRLCTVEPLYKGHSE